jgi:mannitol-1-phosphate 5-dehydrogenase
MSDITADPELLAMARAAFLQESGGGLIYKYSGVDPLFTEAGFRSYADDLLVRMVNPFLRDAVDRIIRDPRRKLGWHDRLIGTMNLALDAGITPVRFARGAAAALRLLRKEQPGLNLDALMDSLWPEPDASPARLCELKRMMLAQDAKA